MKLLIYSHSFAPQIGGVETYVMLLARGLALRRTGKVRGAEISVTVASPTPKGDFDDATLPFTVVRQPSVAELVRLIRRADVVHLAGPVIVPLLFAILLHKPVVIEHHGYQASCPNGLLLFHPTKTACPDHYMRREYRQCLRCNVADSGWLASIRMFVMTGVRRRLCHHAHVNLCISQHVVWRLQLPRSTLVYYGVPKPAEAARKAWGDQGPLSIAYVGRLVREKDVPTLVEAVRLCQSNGCQVALRIIGDGPERGRIEAQISMQQFEPPVEMTGYLQGDSLVKALRDAAAVVIPTMMEETAGLAVMEQMIRGRPVVVSDIGGLAEVAGDGGLRFPSGDARALAACLQRLVDEQGLLEDLGKRARRRALALFTQERMIEEHWRMFDGLVRGGAGQRTGRH